MLDQRRVAAQPDEKREQLFTERYEALLAWALRLTEHRREAAEDLVQDAFVQFMLGRTRLEEIENIDGYLRRMLRYMHCSRLSRSAQHLQETALSVADYDTLRLGWTAIEPPRRMQASEELHQICTYACTRKESSRAGSVLILRFFHDYFPTEIASVLNSTRHCIDQWQRLARREAKLFMNEPGRLRFVGTKAVADAQHVGYLKSDCDLMLALRRIIFDSCQGECLSRAELEEIYVRNNSDALTTPKLAHIVSCPSCLDAVNALLDLPLLAQRYQADSCEPKDPPGDASGGGASGGGSTDLTKKFKHALRETHEHKPHELRIAVNGFVVSSLKVSSELSELNLNLTPDDPIEFVEVCSEQGVQLLFFTVDPTEPQGEQWAWIELSEGRSLEACFRNENGPTLHVVYEDPIPEEALSTGEILNANALSSPLIIVPNSGESKTTARARLRSGLMGVFGPQSRVADATPPRATKDELLKIVAETPIDGQFFTLFSSYAKRAWLPRWSLIVLLSALVVAGFLFFKASLSPTLTATVLLDQATAAEQVSQALPARVRHRFINLEERRSAEGAIVARRRIEIWENHAQGARAQRLYDDANHLIAGTWQTAKGVRTNYHHGSKPQSQPAPATPESLLLNFEDVWQVEPLASSFVALIGQPGLAQVEERPTTYVLTYEKERMIGASRLLKATLTLSKSDLHPIEQTLLVQRGLELREYRFAEASSESLPEKDVAPTVFAIEPELTGGAGETGRPGDWALRDLTTSRVPPSPSTSTPPVASAELEVDVAYLLNQVKADRNEQVALTRSAGGSLRVEGVVDTEQRKQEFQRVLAPVSNNPAVKIEIHTIGEASKRVANVGPVTVQEAEETANNVAADEDLRAYFRKRDPGVPLDDAIRSYSSRVVKRAYDALFHAIELKRLVNRFADVDMRTVAPDARAKWLKMLQQHAAALERETQSLKSEIQPVFFSGTSLSVAEDVSIQSDADLARAVERLHRLALSNKEAIGSAFTISAHSSASAVKSTTFLQSLLRAENLGKQIRQYQAPND